MSIKGGNFGRVLMLAIITTVALPMVASAQNRGRGRGKPTEIFVNGHDARDGRYDKDNQRRRGDRNGDGRIDWRDQDINGDGRVDWRDRDINGDGRIDSRDRVNNGNWGYGNNNNNDWRYGNNNNNDWRYRNGRTANDGYGNYGGSFDLRQTALNAGFADGVKEGRRDRSRGERMDWSDESDYQKATRDYSSRLGDRSLYMTYYRQAFENGYRDGYAGY